MAHRELLAERLTHSVIGAFYEVYHTLGYGFVEYLYLGALELERPCWRRIASSISEPNPASSA